MIIAAAAIMIVIGTGMAAIWTRDILVSPEVDRTAGLLRAREPGTDALFLPHWLAEYATAAALVIAAVALLAGAGWGRRLTLVAIGSLLYTSLDSLGWALGRHERFAYAVPMVGGLCGAVAVLVLLCAS